MLAHFAHVYARVQLEVIGALSGDLLDRVEPGTLDVALITRQPTSQSFAGGKRAVSGRLALTAMAQSMVPPE